MFSKRSPAPPAASPGVDQARPFDSAAELIEQHRLLTEQLPDDRDKLPSALLDALDAFLLRGVATGAVLYQPEERRLCQTLLDYCAVVRERSDRQPMESSLLPFDKENASKLELSDDACPYIGLRAFEDENRDRFFGRTALVQQLTEKLTEQGARALWIIGESGSGKSSVVRAGVLPALRNHPSCRDWQILPVTLPGRAPLAALQETLRRAGIDGATNARTAVVTLDQFEEVFTLSPSRDERKALYEELMRLLAPSRPHRLIITMRSDFVPELARDADSQDMPAAASLYRLLEPNQEAIGRLSRDELREAIELPASTVGLTVVPEVVDRLVTELGSHRDSLPLLQFTMRQLWKRRRYRHILLGAYKDLGGGTNALASCADRLYGDLRAAGKGEATRDLMLRLAAALKDELEVTRSRVSRRDLYKLDVPEATIQEVLDKFVSAELLRQTKGKTSDDDLFEVAHEALVRNWDQLATWLNNVKHSRIILGGLLLRAARWDKDGRPHGQLLSEAELLRAQDFIGSPDYRALGTDPVLEEYVAASVSAKRRGDRLRSLGTVAAGVVMTAAIVGIFLAIKSRHDASEQSARLGAINTAFETYPEVSSLASVKPQQAYRDAENALLQINSLAAKDSVKLERFHRYPLTALYSILAPLAGRQKIDLDGEPGAFSEAEKPSIQWSLDGRRLLVVTGGRARIYNSAGIFLARSRKEKVQKAYLGPPDRGNPVLLSLEDGSVVLWTKERDTTLSGSSQVTDRRLRTAAFSRAGLEIYVGWDDRTASIYTGSGDEELWKLEKHDQDIKHALFSRNALYVATDDGSEARLWKCIGKPQGECAFQATPAEHKNDPIVDIALMTNDDRLVVLRERSSEICRWNQNPAAGPRLRCEDVQRAGKEAPSMPLIGTATQDGQAYVSVLQNGAIYGLYPAVQQLSSKDLWPLDKQRSLVRVSPDGTFLAHFTEANQLEGQLLRLNSPFTDGTDPAPAPPAGSSKAAGSPQGQKDPEKVLQLDPPGEALSAAWSPDSQMLAALVKEKDGSRSVRFWLRDASPRFDLPDHMAGPLYGHEGPIASLRFCRQGAAEGSGDNAIYSYDISGWLRFWDLKNGESITENIYPSAMGPRAYNEEEPTSGSGQHRRRFANHVLHQSRDCRYAAVFTRSASVKLWQLDKQGQATRFRDIPKTGTAPEDTQYWNGFFAQQSSSGAERTWLIMAPTPKEARGADAQIAFVDLSTAGPDRLPAPKPVPTKPKAENVGICRSPENEFFITYPLGPNPKLAPQAHRWKTFASPEGPAVIGPAISHDEAARAGGEPAVVDCEISKGGKHVFTVTKHKDGSKADQFRIWYWNLGPAQSPPPQPPKPHPVFDSDELIEGGIKGFCGTEPLTVWMSCEPRGTSTPTGSGCGDGPAMLNLVVSCGSDSAFLLRVNSEHPESPETYLLQGHGGSILDAEVSQDGKWAATSSIDHTVRIWPVAEASRFSETPHNKHPKLKVKISRLFEKAVLRGHAFDVNRVMFSSDSKHLVSGSRGSTLRLWPAPEYFTPPKSEGKR